jgi:polysaccharide export outer membrane protein
MTLRTLLAGSLAALAIATTAVAATKPAAKPATTNQRVPATATTVRVPPAQSHAAQLPPAPRPVVTPSGPMLNPGAVLDISVYASGKKELDFTATIAPDSSIMVPLAGQTKVGGLDAMSVSRRLQGVYDRSYFVDPQVLVNVREYGGRILVSGEVRQPGIYPVGVGLTALSATVLAGGFTDFASVSRAKIVRTTRNGRTEVVKIDLGKVLKGEIPDLALRDGDRVDVPRRLF